MTSKLQPNALYLGDNGRCTHGRCSGATAKATGRDISGQAMYKLTTADRLEMAKMGAPARCEKCGQH